MVCILPVALHRDEFRTYKASLARNLSYKSKKKSFKETKHIANECRENTQAYNEIYLRFLKIMSIKVTGDIIKNLHQICIYFVALLLK